MKKASRTLTIFMPVFIIALLSCNNHTPTFTITQVDVLDRVYADSKSQPISNVAPISVPRNAQVAFQFAIQSEINGACKISVSQPTLSDGTKLTGSYTSFELLPVHVEANSAGGNTSGVGIDPPDDWWPYLLRKAPFDANEALKKTDQIYLHKETTHGVLVDIYVKAEAKPGVYKSSLILQQGNQKVQTDFSFQVYKTIMSKPQMLIGRWLRNEPINLTSSKPAPEWWSEEHWQLLKNTGKVLRSFHTSMIHTTLVSGEHPLIQPIRKENEQVDFDFQKFDRWVTLFRDLGFDFIEGEPLVFWHWAIPPEIVTMLDQSSGQVTRMELKHRQAGIEKLDQLRKKYGKEETRKRYMHSPEYRAMKGEYMDFLEIFLQSLNRHLDEKGWKQFYIQRVLNEPRSTEDYIEFADLVRKYLPGVTIMNQIHFYFIEDRNKLASYADILLMPLNRLDEMQDLVLYRASEGNLTGLYTMASPLCPWPSYHLDRPLSNNRLFMWLAYLYGAQSYDCWGVNWFYGVDPYKSSMGPMLYNPGGSASSPGYPPGDNWLFYPNKDGLTPSMRMIAWRDGLTDFLLLKMLADKDKLIADEIMKKIARSGTDYKMDAKSYHEARKAILDALDSL